MTVNHRHSNRTAGGTRHTGAPAQGDVAVTTTLGEGSGNAAQGVELSTSQATKNYNNGAAEVE